METYLVKRGAHHNVALHMTGKLGVLNGRHYICAMASTDVRAGRPILTILRLKPLLDDGRITCVDTDDLSNFTRVDPHEDNRVGDWNGMLADGWTLVQREDDMDTAIGDYLEGIFTPLF